jgi:hypothetical protein
MSAWCSMTPVVVSRARATFSCSLCPHAAGAVELADGDTPGAGLGLLVTGFGGPLRLPVAPPVADALIAALAAVDAKRLFDLAPLSAPFYCPDCGSVFCSHHWVSLPLLDDHVFGGTYATCPAGHTRLVDGTQGDGP